LKIITKIIILSFTFISIISELKAADSAVLVPTYSIFFNITRNYGKANFQELPGVASCCPKFSNGEGNGFAIGLELSYPLPYNFSTGFGIGYYILDNKLIAPEYKLIRIDNTPFNAKIEHIIDARISDIAFSPFVSYNPFGGLHLKAGAHVGMIVQNSFYQWEELIEPGDRGVFEDTGLRTRNDTSGSIPNGQTVFTGFNLGVSYDLNLSKNASFIISPTMSYLFGMSNISKNLDWTIDAMLFGLEMKYTPVYTPPKVKIIEEFKENYRIDTMEVLSEDIERNTIVAGQTKSETKIEKSAQKIVTTTFFSRKDTLFRRPLPKVNVAINATDLKLSGQFVTQAFPIVPVLFFDENSSVINPFYYQSVDKSTFDETKLEINSITYQHNLLNITGKRLSNNPTATIQISGYADSTTEGNNCDLAQKRAQAFKDFLINNWAINESQISIITNRKCTPPEPTSSKNDSGYADNRRIEFYSDDESVLGPIVRKNYLEPKTVNPPSITFDPDGSTNKGIESWKLIIRQGDSMIYSNQGKGFPGKKEFPISPSDFRKIFNNEPLSVEFSLKDFENQTSSVIKKVNVIADTNQYELQRLSLILFGVSSEQLSQKAKNDIKLFSKDIKPESIINITGYTDALGSPSLNKQLSNKRAQNTAQYIHQIAPEIHIEKVLGVGSIDYPPGINSYALPVERFLSRTVFIEVLNKIK
jgi:outer membrane protein OmpA-like peptidoglycan-associated protein